MIRRATIAAAGLLVATAVDAGAQGPVLDGRLDPRTRSSVERLVDSAQAAGLPGEPLVLKALEGASKGADGARIMLAVRRLAATLGEARQALGAASAAGEIAAGASALQAGIPGGMLTEVRAARGDRPVVVALSVLTDLVVAGVPADVARDAVIALARSGESDEQLLAFRQRVGRDIHAGMPPAAAAGVQRPGTGSVPAAATGGRPSVPTLPPPPVSP